MTGEVRYRFGPHPHGGFILGFRLPQLGGFLLVGRIRLQVFERNRSQPPRVRLRRAVRPAERPGHIATTAHVQAAYPFVAEAGLGSRGVLIGRDVYGGPFVIDPWLLYQEDACATPTC